MNTPIPGPTYRRDAAPRALPPAIRDRPPRRAPTSSTPPTCSTSPGARADGQIRHVVLPKELTGVEANILVLVGR